MKKIIAITVEYEDGSTEGWDGTGFVTTTKTHRMVENPDKSLSKVFVDSVTAQVSYGKK